MPTPTSLEPRPIPTIYYWEGRPPNNKLAEWVWVRDYTPTVALAIVSAVLTPNVTNKIYYVMQ